MCSIKELDKTYFLPKLYFIYCTCIFAETDCPQKVYL